MGPSPTYTQPDLLQGRGPGWPTAPTGSACMGARDGGQVGVVGEAGPGVLGPCVHFVVLLARPCSRCRG